MPKKDLNEPEVDESLLTPEQREELRARPSRKGFFLFCAVLLLLIAACLAVIFSLGGPTGD